MLLGPQPIFTIQAELEAIMKFGRTPYGERRLIDITGGRVTGPKLNGRILPGGADWQIIRSDGAADIRRATSSRPMTAHASSSIARACGMAAGGAGTSWRAATVSIPRFITSAPRCGLRPRTRGRLAQPHAGDGRR